LFTVVFTNLSCASQINVVRLSKCSIVEAAG